VIFVFFFFMPSVKFFPTNSRLCTEGTHMNNDRKGLKWHKVQIPVALRQWKPQDWIRLFMVMFWVEVHGFNVGFVSRLGFLLLN
jgi:hypothetical protein